MLDTLTRCSDSILILHGPWSMIAHVEVGRNPLMRRIEGSRDQGIRKHEKGNWWRFHSTHSHLQLRRGNVSRRSFLHFGLAESFLSLLLSPWLSFMRVLKTYPSLLHQSPRRKLFTLLFQVPLLAIPPRWSFYWQQLLSAPAWPRPKPALV